MNMINTISEQTALGQGSTLDNGLCSCCDKIMR